MILKTDYIKPAYVSLDFANHWLIEEGGEYFCARLDISCWNTEVRLLPCGPDGIPYDWAVNLLWTDRWQEAVAIMRQIDNEDVARQLDRLEGLRANSPTA